jgi:hypothetical protein
MTSDIVFAQKPCLLDIFLHLLDKIVVEGGALNLLAVGERDKSGDGNQQDFVGCILPVEEIRP